MSAVERVLVIGAGLAGVATAVALAQAGVDVDLVDSQSEIAARGSGITLQGNALRELRRLGVWEEVLAHGFPFDTTLLRAPDAEGTVLVALDDVRAGGPDLPALLGMPRPTLARILLDRAREVGVDVRLGVSATTLAQDGEGVDVGSHDGTSRRYDLVVGADGVRSWTRTALGIPTPTVPVGMAIWRVFGARPATVTEGAIYYGGPGYLAGYCPTGQDSLYAYIVEDAQDRSGLDPQQQLDLVRELAAGYHGPWDDIRADLTDASRINYTWFETHVLPAPWNRGRVVLIGDAAHACPPTLAQGGAQALEDAAVLSELLISADAVDDALWAAFSARRVARAAAVVDSSNQLCRWLMDGERGDVADLMRTTMALVTAPC